MDHERYSLLDVIGSGGMATVWRARDTRLGRLVALKRPHPAPAGSETITRFAREARAAATVSHPHLVAVYDVGEDDLGPYLVMELIEGPSLAHGTPDGSIAVLGANVASALAALHDAGVVHGDVKPGNILLADVGAKLTDFGIARTPHDTAALTAPGIALGTPAYAAPETIATGVRHAPADVYSLAAVLHELVTGSRWTPAAGATQAMPPAAWRAVLAPALANDPARRPSARDFAADLSGLDRDGDPHAATVPMAVTATTATAATAATVEPAEVGAGRGHPAGGQWAAIVVALVALVAVGVVVWSASRPDGGALPAVSDDLPVVPTDGATATAPTVVATVVDTPPPTIAPTAAPVATDPPPTDSPPTEPPPPAPPGPDELAGELVALVEGVPPNELKPKESRDIVKRVDDSLAAATNGDLAGAEKQLREAAERIARHVDGDEIRERATDLIAGLSSALGIDAERTTEPLTE